MFWNEDVGFYEQVSETQLAVLDAMNGLADDEASEPCGIGFTRLLWQVFTVDNELTVKVVYLYSNAPDSDEWAGLKKVIISKF